MPDSNRPKSREGGSRTRRIFTRSFWQSLIAILVGNAIYYGVYRYLPPRAQHQLYQIDWGLAVDFWICVVCYQLIKLFR